MVRLTLSLILMLLYSACTPAAANDNPEELGVIHWRTDFAAAQAEAKRTQRPMLVLFDEVPGCSTVKRFGNTVLTHPLVAEAAETLFVPTLVYNNKAIHTALLKSFNEPSWNNPVVRIIQPDRTPLAPRHAGDYTVNGMLGQMRTALTNAHQPVPKWLGLAAPPTHTKTATFGMYCFWSGEVVLGAIDGVFQTQAGFLEGHEVVKVTYDPKQVDQATLHRIAKAAGQADQSFSTSQGFRPSAKDTQYQLRRHPLSKLPMSTAQASKVNAALGQRKDPRAFLSPRQIAVWQAMR